MFILKDTPKSKPHYQKEVDDPFTTPTSSRENICTVKSIYTFGTEFLLYFTEAAIAHALVNEFLVNGPRGAVVLLLAQSKRE